MLSRFKNAVAGFFYNTRFFDASSSTTSSQVYPSKPDDINKSLQGFDYQTIVAASRKLYANSGIAKSVDDKAVYAVGRAWLPVFTGKNKEWGQLATEWLTEKYYPISDVRGGIYDFRTNLFVDSISIDRDGDFGVLLTESEIGWPQTQRIPSHRITSGDDTDGQPLRSGPYTGLIIRQGVIYNKRGRAVAYRIRTDNGLQDVSARDFIHIFDPSWYDQGRGIPAFTHAINELLSLKKTQGFEQQAMEICSAISLTEENAEGVPDQTDPANSMKGEPATSKSTGFQIQTFLGGIVKYFKAGTGSKLSSLVTGRPGPAWESFWNRIIKTACVGTGWPYELLWSINTLGGASLRAVLAKAKRTVEDRQDLLRPGAKREVQYAVAKAIKLGELPPSDEWFRWDFTLPAFITADAGREAQQEREDYKLKLTTLERLLAPQGVTVEQHFRQLAHEDRLREEIAKEEGVKVEALGGTLAVTVKNQGAL